MIWNNKIVKKFLLLLLVGLSLPQSQILAQEVYNDYQETLRGVVVEIVKQENRVIPGTGTEHLFQTIKAEILEGERRGEVVTIENDYLALKEGDRFYFNYLVDISGAEIYQIVNIDRRGPLLFLGFIFIAAVVLLGGKQGIRSLLSLVGSFLAIFYILLPGLLNGWNPIIASSAVAGAILFAAIFFTHGFNREALVAYVGTISAVLITGLFAAYVVDSTSLSGFANDESIYLNFNTNGALNFSALLLGGIIIGILGVLDDISITQAAIVSELYSSNPKIGRREVFDRAMRVGREHVSALVNTLVLAYTGASLPLLLYFYNASSDFGAMLNLESVATEIVRALVGSIGLILTVPLVTVLAVFYLKRDGNTTEEKKKQYEKHIH